MNVGTLPDGVRGFDANATVSAAAAALLKAAGYEFAIRYVRRHEAHPFDLTASEVTDILGAGLGLMVVQHVANPGWSPTAEDGSSYGVIARQSAQAAGIPAGATVWCDLEGVASGTPHADVIAYCNAWCDAVAVIGYEPGLYVGDSCGLTPDELYHGTKFARFWSAYNANADTLPSVRGVCMRQHAAKATELVAGFTNQNFDVDVIAADALGGTPSLVFA